MEHNIKQVNMRRETKNEIVITVIVSLLIVAAAVYGLSTQNQATSNENFNSSLVNSVNQNISTLTNNGENVLNILNTSSSDNPTSTSTGNYQGTFIKNITIRINSSMM
jgi:heme/copper-type cytochrome/quinol oxidase subunit 2